jgi:hypothetical protein
MQAREDRDMAHRADDRSIGDLVGDLTRQIGTLVRQELDLARTEITTSARAAGQDAALVGVGGALLHAALLTGIATVVLLLVEMGIDAWISALLVGVLVAALGAILIARGRAGLAAVDLAPRRTVETLKDDADWAKERIT